MRQANINRSFGSRIERRARELQLSLRQIATSADMDPSFLSRIVAGERNPPSDEIIERLAGALELPPTELLLEAGRLPNLPEGTRNALPEFFRLTRNLNPDEIRGLLAAFEAFSSSQREETR